MAEARKASARGRILPPFLRAIGRTTRLENGSFEIERYEPLLRRSVPVMIAVFLLTLAGSRATERLFHRDMSINEARTELIFLADGIANGITDSQADENLTQTLEDALPPLALSEDRAIYVTNESGEIEIITSANTSSERTANEIELGRAMALGSQTGVIELLQESGDALLIASAQVGESGRRVVVVQPRSAALDDWNQTIGINVFLYVSTAFVILLLGSAFYWQAERARMAQCSYQQAHLRLNKSLTHGKAGLWDWNIDTAQIEWSQSMYDILGLTHPGHPLSIGSVMRLMHEDDRDLFTIADALINKPNAIVDRAFRMRHADGSWRWLQARAEMVDVRGEGRRLIGVAVDITEERKRAERSARNDRRLREALESLSESFVLWDEDQRLVLSNSKYRQLNGLDQQDMVEGTKRSRIEALRKMPLIDAGSGQGIERSFLDDGARSFEINIKDGRWFQLSERRTQDGGLVSIATDITALKVQERRLTESQAQLRASVTDLMRSRTQLERQTEELRALAGNYARERNRAEEALRVKTNFLMSMSHELRTPLNAIIGFSDVMSKNMLGPLGSPIYDGYARDIHNSGVYLLQLINDVLDMSKIEAGRFTLEREEMDLAPLVSESLRFVSMQAEEKGLALKSRVSPNLRVDGDRRALKQVLLNLLSNAVKFTPEGGHIEVRARQISGSVTLTIEDNGIGMSPDFLKKLGRPFEQAQNQLTRSHAGSGLGLAITKKITELHGGSMRVRSRIGKGTIISVRLPLDTPGHYRSSRLLDSLEAAKSESAVLN